MANITRIQNSPEVYSITESFNPRVSQTWKTSGTRSEQCYRIVTRTLTGTRFNPTTEEWEKYSYQAEVREPIVHEKKERAPRIVKRELTHNDRTRALIASLPASNDLNTEA